MPRRDARQTDSHQSGSQFDDFVNQSIIAALLKALLPRMGRKESISHSGSEMHHSKSAGSPFPVRSLEIDTLQIASLISYNWGERARKVAQWWGYMNFFSFQRYALNLEKSSCILSSST